MNQRQSLACMQGDCHATERQRIGLQTTGSQLIPRPRFLQARFGTTLFSTPSGHVYRRTIRIEEVMHFSRTGCTAYFRRCKRSRRPLAAGSPLLCLRRRCYCKVNTSCKRQTTQRAASESCPESFHEYHWSGSVSLINRSKANRRPNSRKPAFEKCKP